MKKPPGGRLVLVPTPLAAELPLEPTAWQTLATAAAAPQLNLIVVETPKWARRRWLHWQLPPDAIDRFGYLSRRRPNIEPLCRRLDSGATVYLLSDTGLPAFCDPGQNLVHYCWQKRIPISATPFPHAVSLGVALSGFPAEAYFFAGFLPQKRDDCQKRLKAILANPVPTVLLDTPYRVRNVIDDLAKIGAVQAPKRLVFFGLDLNAPNEITLRVPLSELINWAEQLPDRAEFVAVIGPKGFS